AAAVVWTTTPWTIPGNRAICYSGKIAYGLYRVTAAPPGNWARVGDVYLLADALAARVMQAARVEGYRRLRSVAGREVAPLVCIHPLHALGYAFPVPLLEGDHVTDQEGTGLVHTAPGHGRDDFDIWMANAKRLAERGIDTAIPFTVDGEGRFTAEAPGF